MWLWCGKPQLSGAPELNPNVINLLSGISGRARDINTTLFSHSCVLCVSHWQLVTARPSHSYTRCPAYLGESYAWIQPLCAREIFLSECTTAIYTSNTMQALVGSWTRSSCTTWPVQQPHGLCGRLGNIRLNKLSCEWVNLTQICQEHFEVIFHTHNNLNLKKF